MRENNKVNKKEIAAYFLALATSGKVREAFAKHVQPGFHHHSQYFEVDRRSLQIGMEDSANGFPNQIYETVHALADEDLLAVHGRVRLELFGKNCSQ